jgi:membrane protease YdiL (CAAX protease family)
MTTTTTFVRRHPVATYFALTFAISWVGAGLAIGEGGGMRGSTPASDPRFQYALIAMLAGPSIAGILMTALVHGRQGLRDLLARLLMWRAGAAWYAVALLTAPLLMLATLLTLSLTSREFLPGIVMANDGATILLVGLAVGASAGLLEELGWTGFAIPALRLRHDGLTTGLIVGIWWSAWHLLPNIWAREAASGELGLSTYMTWTILNVFVGYLTAFRVLMAWVYDHTRSLLVGMLMHVSFTASLLVFNPLGISGANLVTFSAALAAAIWVVVALVALAGSTTPRRLPLRRRAA